MSRRWVYSTLTRCSAAANRSVPRNQVSMRALSAAIQIATRGIAPTATTASTATESAHEAAVGGGPRGVLSLAAYRWG